MTSVAIPEFVLKLFEQKVVEINSIIVHKLCEHYMINEQEAKEFLQKEININFNVVNENIEQVKVVNKTKKKMDNDARLCMARVYLASELVVKQCSRAQLDGKEFCKLHQKLHEEGKLKYGTINEDKPDCISSEKLKLKTKRNIY